MTNQAKCSMGPSLPLFFHLNIVMIKEQCSQRIESSQSLKHRGDVPPCCLSLSPFHSLPPLSSYPLCPLVQLPIWLSHIFSVVPLYPPQCSAFLTFFAPCVPSGSQSLARHVHTPPKGQKLCLRRGAPVPCRESTRQLLMSWSPEQRIG